LAICATETPEPSTPTINGAELITKVRDAHPELFAPPPVDPWKTGLGDALRTPQEAVCYVMLPENKLRILGEGVWMPSDRANAVFDRLVEFERYPRKVQATIDGLVGEVESRSICTAVVSGSAKVAASEAHVRYETERDPGYSAWAIIKWSALTGLVAATVSAIVTFSATR